jgi:hypothetical protein
MIATSQVTPTPTKAEFGSHRPTDRRSASRKQASTILHTEWPVTTRTSYDKLVRGVVDPELVANLKLRRLCEARAALGRALLALDNAILDHNPAKYAGEVARQQKRIYSNLRSRRDRVERALLGFPLEVR